MTRTREGILKRGTTGVPVPTVAQALLGELGLDPVDLPEDNPTRGRILDVAIELFVAKGISATTMREIAARAELSRAWLYRQFASRDDIVRAVIVREAHRVSIGMVKADDPDRPVEESVTSTFVYIVSSLRGSPLISRFLAHEPELVASFIVGEGSAPFIRAMVRSLEAYLQQRAELTQAHSRIAAEAIIRLVVSTGLTPIALLDFDDPAELRRFAGQLIPPLLQPPK